MKKIITNKWTARNPMKENSPASTTEKKNRQRHKRNKPEPELEDLILWYVKR